MEIKLGDDVIEHERNFNPWKLTKEQNLSIDKLTLDETLKKCYKKHGLCKECKQPKTDGSFCFDNEVVEYCPCNAKHFQQNFKNWTSGNHNVDKFIQKTQLKAKNNMEVLEWIEYDRFENVEYLAKGGFGTTYKAIWEDGPILYWDSKNNQWERKKTYNPVVTLKCLHNSQNITAEFLSEVA